MLNSFGFSGDDGVEVLEGWTDAICDAKMVQTMDRLRARDFLENLGDLRMALLQCLVGRRRYK